MQIKQQALTQQLNKKIAPFCVLVGQDYYLHQLALDEIRQAILKNRDCEEKRLFIESQEDWKLFEEEANSYSLFSQNTLLNVVYEKKTFEVAGKKIIEAYLNNLNPRVFVVLRALNVAPKQIPWLNNHENTLVVVSYPLKELEMKQWIGAQLKTHGFSQPMQVVDLIFQYTQGNMGACAQAIEKIALTYEKGAQITAEDALSQLSNQCDYGLYELTEACLLGKSAHAIDILRQAANNKTEATLVLWILTQEVRVLTQLSALIAQKIDITSACNQLKLWPSKASLYQARLKQSEAGLFPKLLLYAGHIDKRIKSSSSELAWLGLESLCLSFCLGRLVGDVCAQ